MPDLRDMSHVKKNRKFENLDWWYMKSESWELSLNLRHKEKNKYMKQSNNIFNSF